MTRLIIFLNKKTLIKVLGLSLSTIDLTIQLLKTKSDTVWIFFVSSRVFPQNFMRKKNTFGCRNGLPRNGGVFYSHNHRHPLQTCSLIFYFFFFFLLFYPPKDQTTTNITYYIIWFLFSFSSIQFNSFFFLNSCCFNNTRNELSNTSTQILILSNLLLGNLIYFFYLVSYN